MVTKKSTESRTEMQAVDQSNIVDNLFSKIEKNKEERPYEKRDLKILFTPKHLSQGQNNFGPGDGDATDGEEEEGGQDKKTATAKKESTRLEICSLPDDGIVGWL